MAIPMKPCLHVCIYICALQGTDFCSTAGFDTLVKRLKEGKQMIVDVEEYLEKRLETRAPPSLCYPL